jgi:beta-glucosidase|eukprot:COSAG01_NODE_2566_length_7447_cov_108.279668_4_plen_113_part_00
MVRRPLRPFRRPFWLRFTYVTSVLVTRNIETQRTRVGPSLRLPGQQESLIQMGIASGKTTIVLLFTTSPKNGAWVPKVDAVINAGYPQNGGAAAIADTLLGRISPSGRLPIT